MRTNLAADFDASRPRFTKQPHTACGGDMLAMNVMIAKIREQNVPRDYDFLANSGPAGQPEKRAPIAVVHDPVGHEIVILAVIKHGHTDHARILDRAPHHFVVLDAMTI